MTKPEWEETLDYVRALIHCDEPPCLTESDSPLDAWKKTKARILAHIDDAETVLRARHAPPIPQPPTPGPAR